VKLDSGEWRNTLKPCALGPLLYGYADRLIADGNLLGRNVRARLDIPDRITIPLDERLFIRLFENLCSNALRYTPEGGLIRIEADYTPGGLSGDAAGAQKNTGVVTVIVSDNGCGIPEEDIPFIFDPFYRGSNSRREDGSGLGLSVVKSIVDSFGWGITVISGRDAGSTFRISIPV
jgi:signal transduction histidine kinase